MFYIKIYKTYNNWLKYQRQILVKDNMFSYKASHSYNSRALQYCSDHPSGEFGNDTVIYFILYVFFSILKNKKLGTN